MSNQLRLAGCLLTGFISISSVAQPVQVLDRTDEAYIQRVLQYEYQLGSKLQADIALCIDDAMGNSWFLGDDPSAEIRKSVVEKLRHASETCTVATSSEKSRLAAQLRAMTEKMLKRAQRLEKPIASARDCVTQSGSSPEFKNCLTKALGKPPSEVDWVYWMVLFERKTAS